MTRRLLVLNGIAVLGVIIHHAHGWGLIAMFLWTHRYLPVEVPNFDQQGSFAYFGLRFFEQLMQFGLAAFLFVSGYFVAFATHRDKLWLPWRYIFVRLKSLIIPYLFWCTLLILALFIEGQRYGLVEYFRMVITGSIKGPYYYVIVLIQLYLIAPILVRFGDRHWKWLLIVTGFIQVVSQLYLYGIALGVKLPFLPDFKFPLWSFQLRVFWFALGIAVGFHPVAFKSWAVKARYYSLVSAIIFFILGMLEWELIFSYSHFIIPIETVIDSFYCVSILLLFFGFENIKIPFSKRINYLGERSYGIFLAHVPVQEYLARGIYHLMPVLLGVQVIFFPLLIVAGLGIPVLLMWIVERSRFRPYYKYIFG